MAIYLTPQGEKLASIIRYASRDADFRKRLLENPVDVLDIIDLYVPKNVKLVVRTYNENEWPLILPPLRSTEQPDERQESQ